MKREGSSASHRISNPIPEKERVGKCTTCGHHRYLPHLIDGVCREHERQNTNRSQDKVENSAGVDRPAADPSSPSDADQPNGDTEIPRMSDPGDEIP